jgi:prevent-host-death family protein
LTKLVKKGSLGGVSAQVNIYEAKTQLSKLVERAAAGEEIVIARGGRPMARLVPLARSTGRRQAGAYRGQMWIAPDFDELPADVLAGFEDASA